MKVPSERKDHVVHGAEIGHIGRERLIPVSNPSRFYPFRTATVTIVYAWSIKVPCTAITPISNNRVCVNPVGDIVNRVRQCRGQLACTAVNHRNNMVVRVTHQRVAHFEVAATIH